MRLSTLSAGLLGIMLTAAPLSAASAQDDYYRYHHRHYGLIGGVFDAAGAVVVGAFTIVTAPIVLIADTFGGPHYRRPTEVYGYERPYGEGYDGRYSYRDRDYDRDEDSRYSRRYEREDNDADDYRGDRDRDDN